MSRDRVDTERQCHPWQVGIGHKADCIIEDKGMWQMQQGCTMIHKSLLKLGGNEQRARGGKYKLASVKSAKCCTREESMLRMVDVRWHRAGTCRITCKH